MKIQTVLPLTLGLLLISGIFTGCSEPIVEETPADEDVSEAEVEKAAVEETTVQLEETDVALEEEAAKAAAKDAIRSVIERDFTSPDKEFTALEEAVYNAQYPDMSEDEYQDFISSDVYQALMSHYEDSFAPYFTEDEYGDFINTMSMKSALNSADTDFQTAVQNLTIEQSENENAPNNYLFSFEVVSIDETGNQKIHQLEGMAIVVEQGKIGRMQLTAAGDLLQTINAVNNSDN